MNATIETLPRGRPATWAYTCYTLETAVGIVEAAAAAGRAVILMVSENAFKLPTGPALMTGLHQITITSPVEVQVQLDHVRDLALVRRAFEHGAHGVMIDGSDLPLKENASLTAAAVEIADEFDGWVEGELGRLSGDEDLNEMQSALRDGYTQLDQIVPFLRDSGASCLAVSVGNVHGTYSRLPRLDWKRLAEAARLSSVPLALHGATGIPEPDISRAVALGIAKINVNTELRQQYFLDMRSAIDDFSDGLDVLSTCSRHIAGARRVAAGKLRIL